MAQHLLKDVECHRSGVQLIRKDLRAGRGLLRRYAQLVISNTDGKTFLVSSRNLSRPDSHKVPNISK